MGLCLIVKSGGGVDTSSATASAEQILSGYTIYRNDNKITGSMTNVGTQTKSGLNAGGSVTINSGYHNGSGSVTANTLVNQTQCDIPNQWWCLTGYSYWANGSKYDGLMVNRGAKSWSIGANGSQTIEDGWHNGSGAVKQSINVDNGEWGPTPTTTNQQLCWQGWYYSKNRWCWGSGNLTAANIKKDITIFGVKGTWQGWVDKTVWIIKNGDVQSGFAITNIIQCSDAYQTTGKTSWGTWMIGGWVDNDDGGGSGRFDITGVNTLDISFVQISGKPYWRTNARFSIEFSYWWGYTGTSTLRHHMQCNDNNNIWSGYTSADYTKNLGIGTKFTVTNGSATSYDNPNTWTYYITVHNNYITASGTKLNKVSPSFSSNHSSTRECWQIRNFWVTRE